MPPPGEKSHRMAHRFNGLIVRADDCRIQPKERVQAAQLVERPAQLRLEDHRERNGQCRERVAEQPGKSTQIQQDREQPDQHQQDHDSTQQRGRVGAAHQLENDKEDQCDQQNIQDVPPVLWEALDRPEDLPHWPPSSSISRR
jgi:hypothetical protein